MVNKRNDRGSMTVNEAGKKGGKTTSSTHGRQFYQEIGHKGGQRSGERTRDLVARGKRSER